MQRTKQPINGNGAKITTLSELVSRASLFGRLGFQYGGDRDIYEALGYADTIQYSDYLASYTRQDIARAIIDRPVDATWQGEVVLTETDDDEETLLEKAWVELVKLLSLKTQFTRLDRLAGIGEYGVFVLGFNDPAAAETDGLLTPVIGGENVNLVYVKPLGQGSARIDTWDQEVTSPRFGLPITYEISISDPADETRATTSALIKIHHTRVLHVAGQLLESETRGTPRLQAVFNRLQDLQKIVGGSAEMFWRGARPGFHAKIQEDYDMSPTEIADLEDEFDEYEHKLRRILFNKGIDMEALEAQVSEPTAHVAVQIQMISSVTGIPQRILTGSERGELASSQDLVSWRGLTKARREEFAEPRIVRPFVDTMIDHGILPPPQDAVKGYSVKWEDLWAPSEAEKADIGKTRAEATAAYANAPLATQILPIEVFLEHLLGMSKEQLETIKQAQLAAVAEEQLDFANAEPEGEE